MDLKRLLQKIVGTNHGATQNILKGEELDVKFCHSLDNTDLKKIGTCAPCVIDVQYSF